MKEFYPESYFTHSFALQSLCLSPPNPAEHTPMQPHLQPRTSTSAERSCFCKQVDLFERTLQCLAKLKLLWWPKEGCQHLLQKKADCPLVPTAAQAVVVPSLKGWGKQKACRCWDLYPTQLPFPSYPKATKLEARWCLSVSCLVMPLPVSFHLVFLTTFTRHVL